MKGFSLIELLIAVSIFTIVGIVVWTFEKDIFFLDNNISNGAMVQQEVRTALRTMSSEIRAMSQSSTGAYQISQASTSTLTFYTNVDSDSLKERVRYFLQTNTLKRGIIKPTGNPYTYNSANEKINDLAHNITATSSIFFYYDKNYTGTTTPLVQPVDVLAIRLVKIYLSIDRDLNRSPLPEVLSTQVSIRNLKDNL